MMLTGIQLLEDHKIVNCIIKDRYLASYVLRLPLNKYQLEVEGKWNKGTVSDQAYENQEYR